MPGFGHLVRREFRTGLFFLTMTGMVLTVGWALLGMIAPLTLTLTGIGYSRALIVWMLAVLYGVAAALHVASVWSAAVDDEPRLGRGHPMIASCASMIVPGWGQLINGHRVRGALLLAGLWFLGAAWVLASPAFSGILDSLGLFVPGGPATLASPVVRWSITSVIWALGIYDAAVGAAGH